MMKKSNILLILGLSVLLVGAIMALWNIEPYADYVLIVGALLVIIRGGMHARERAKEAAENNNPEKEE